MTNAALLYRAIILTLVLVGTALPVFSQEAKSEDVFRSTFTDGVFRSEYFGFTIAVPKKWIRMDEADSRIRQETKDFVRSNSNVDVSNLKDERSHLFTFSVKTLGATQNYRIACHVRKAPAGTTAEQKSLGLEKALSGVAGFRISVPTHLVTLGENTFYAVESVASVKGQTVNQTTYFTIRKGHVLTFTTGYDDKTKPLLLDSMKSLKFEDVFNIKK